MPQGQYTQRDLKGAYSSEDLAPETAAKPQRFVADALGVENPYGQAALDLVEGIGKGGLALAIGTGDVVRRLMGDERIMHRPDVQRMITPTTTAQQIGFGGEKILEFLLPGRAIAAGAKTLQALTSGVRGAKAVDVASRAMLEAGGAGGIAALQTGGDTEAIRDAMLTAGGLSAGTNTLAQAAVPVSRALTESARAQYARVLNATKEGNKFRTEKVVPRLLDEKVTALTMKGLARKTSSQVKRAGQAISDEFANLPPGSAVELGPVLQRLDKTATEALTVQAGGKAIAKGPLAQQGLDHVDALKQTLTRVAEKNPQTGALEIPVERLRQVRQYFDSIAAKAKRYEGKALADHSQAEAHGMAADAIRRELGQQFPSIDKLNKEYAFWKDVHQVISDTLLRRQGQAKPLGRKLGEAAGAAGGLAKAGLPGMALGRAALSALEKLTTSPAWGTISAVQKDKLAKALAASNRGGAEFWITKMTRVAATAHATHRDREPSPAALQ